MIKSNLTPRCNGTGKWHNGIESYVKNLKGGDEIMFGGMTVSKWKIPSNHFNKAYMPSDPKNKDLSRVANHVYK